MWRDDAYLLDMLIASRDVVELSEGLSRSELEHSALHQNALIRLLTVIGEAANHVSDDTQAQHPEIDWGEIIAFRNRLVHGYFDIDLDKVWDAIETGVPELILQLEPLVPSENP